MIKAGWWTDVGCSFFSCRYSCDFLFKFPDFHVFFELKNQENFFNQISLQLADVFFADLPRIRLDRRMDRPRSRKTIWEPQPNTIHEENEDENVFNSSNLELNNTLQQIELGEFELHKANKS